MTYKVADTDKHTLLLVAEKIPEKITTRVLQRPYPFRKLADVDDRRLDRVPRLPDGD